MNLDRRNFFKTVCVAGATLAVGNSFGASNSDGNAIEFQGVLYDSTRCLGCRAC